MGFGEYFKMFGIKGNASEQMLQYLICNYFVKACKIKQMPTWGNALILKNHKQNYERKKKMWDYKFAIRINWPSKT